MSAIETAGPAGGVATLRANRDFRLLLSGQAVSALGDAVSVTAMPLLVLLLTLLPHLAGRLPRPTS